MDDRSSSGTERDLDCLVFEDPFEYFQWIGVSERLEIVFNFIRQATLGIELLESYNGLFNICLAVSIAHNDNQDQLAINLSGSANRTSRAANTLLEMSINTLNHSRRFTYVDPVEGST